MAQLALRVGCHSARGLRPNNEDSFIADPEHQLFLVADGMGGQEKGELASSMAVDIIPKVVYDQLAAHEDASQAVRRALDAANDAIIQASRNMPHGRRMGTTAVLALQTQGRVWVAGLGDSRAYLVRRDRVEQLTVDHSVAHALVASGALTPEEARQSHLQHVLYKFLGCAEMKEEAEVRPFTPDAGDILLLGSDGLTNYLADEDLLAGRRWHDPQAWAEYLVDLALARGSKDNVTCVVVGFAAVDDAAPECATANEKTDPDFTL